MVSTFHGNNVVVPNFCAGTRNIDIKRVQYHCLMPVQEIQSCSQTMGSLVEDFEVHRSKRVRRSVERLVIGYPEREQCESLPGKGVALRSIPNICYKLSKITGKTEVMEALHVIMFKRKGAVQRRKKAVLDFNGFAFPDEVAEKEISYRLNTLNKIKLGLINQMLDVLDIKRGQGDKQAKIHLLISFLKEPKILSEELVAKKEKSKRKRKRQQKKIGISSKSTKVKEAKKDEIIQRFMGDDSLEEPADEISLERIKEGIRNMLDPMADDEFSTVTTRMIMARLNTIFGCDMRPRKSQVKDIAQIYAQERLC